MQQLQQPATPKVKKTAKKNRPASKESIKRKYNLQKKEIAKQRKAERKSKSLKTQTRYRYTPRG